MMLVRTLLYYFIYNLTILFFALSSLILIPFSYPIRYAWLSLWAKFNIWTLGIIVGIKANIKGRENIPNSDEKVVVLSNHQSAWETLFFQTIFGQQTWLLKRELLWLPVFGWALALLKPIAIDRSKGREAIKKLLVQGRMKLDEKIWLIIFPEGTRKPYAELSQRSIDDIKIGGMLLAAKCHCTILLVRHNSGKFWPKNSLLKTGTIDIAIAEPFKSDDVNEIRQKCADFFYAKDAK